MANNHVENEEVMTVKDPETKKDIKVVKPRKKLNPIVKWALIAAGSAIVIGGVVFLVVKGKKVPTEAITKTAEVAAEIATAA